MTYEQRSYTGAATDTVLSANITTGALAFSVNPGDGASYPDGSGGPFYVIVDYDNSKAEKIRVTSRSVDSFTVPASNGRGVDGTIAQAHGAGAKVRHVWTATDAQEANRAAFNTVGQVTTKGDVLTGTGANALGRTAVGVDNTVLAANSSQPGGVSWKTVAALLATLATTKGDLFVFNGTTVVRLGVGTDGTVLTADSTQTAGVRFTTAPSATGNLLAVKQQLSTYTLNVGSFAAVDSTNVTVTFTAPGSGRVLVAVGGITNSTFGQPTFTLATHGTTTDITGTSGQGYTHNTNGNSVGLYFVVSGLTPGSSYSWDLLGKNTASSYAVTLVNPSLLVWAA